MCDALQARTDLTAALRSASRMGLGEGVCNHFSREVPGAAGRFLVNPQGLHWSEVRPSDLVVVDAAGRKISGAHDVEPTAFFIHGALHRGKPSARCVLHTHMPYATALTVVHGGRLEWAHQNSLRFTVAWLTTTFTTAWRSTKPKARACAPSWEKQASYFS